uniref:Uncharacterized protein n=1 Tax=Triticum urartu TaxID=4572 RepID=A0A8R7UDG1_TRIUA
MRAESVSRRASVTRSGNGEAWVAVALQMRASRRCAGWQMYMAMGTVGPYGWHPQPAAVAALRDAQRWRMLELTKESEVLAPTSATKPATRALLRRMTSSCASICGPRPEPRSPPLFPTTAQVGKRRPRTPASSLMTLATLPVPPRRRRWWARRKEWRDVRKDASRDSSEGSASAGMRRRDTVLGLGGPRAERTYGRRR